MQWILILFRRKLYPLFLIGVVFISSPPGFPDFMMTSVISGEIPFCLYFPPIHDKLLIENWESLVDF